MVARKLKVGKVVSALMAMVLTFMFVLNPISVNAQTTRGALCQNCNNGQMVLRGTSYGEWHSSGEQLPCIHGYVYGVDKIRTRSVIKTYSCNFCDVGFDQITEERMRECHGFNR